MDGVRIKNGTIELPPSLSGWLGDLRELSYFIQGDTLILKKVQPAKLSEIAGRVSEEEMKLDEIVAEVHLAREERDHAGRR